MNSITSPYVLLNILQQQHKAMVSYFTNEYANESHFFCNKLLISLLSLRFCEAYNIEKNNTLKNCLEHNKPPTNLYAYFQKSYKTYGLDFLNFEQYVHFFKTQNIVFQKIIDFFYAPELPFNELPLQILGYIHEFFLAQKKAVQKEQGVYYTPNYIIDYIIKNSIHTVFKKREKKEQKKIRILDPACGSGFFLIEAYHFLLQQYDPEKKFTFEQKKEILSTQIYGIDIDKDAVRLTKFCLWLMCCQHSPPPQQYAFATTLLPIFCANSLVHSDFYKSNQLSIQNTENEYNNANNCIDLNPVFGDIVYHYGGFDIIIGNPPYNAKLDAKQQKYFKKKYNLNTTDTAALFIAFASKILNNKGINAFIVPKALTYASNWAAIRELILPNLIQIADCKKVWKNVNLETCIFITQKNSYTSHFNSFVLQHNNNIPHFEACAPIPQKACKLFDCLLNGLTKTHLQIGEKIKQQKQTFNDILENKRGAGLQKQTIKTQDIDFILQKKIQFKLIGGKNIGRYAFATNAKNIEFLNPEYKNFDEKAIILPNSILVQNIVSFVKNPQDSVQIRACIYPPSIQEKEQYLILDTVNQLFSTNNLYDMRFILGILNSRLVSWYVYHFILAHASMTMHFDKPVTAKIPFCSLNFSLPAHTQLYNNLIAQVQKRMDISTIKSTEITEIENNINKIVYNLYQLTPSEVAVIEKG